MVPAKYTARQTTRGLAAIARRHGFAATRTVYAQQHPFAIDAGVFHNDVIAVGHGTMLFCHERAWLDANAVLADLAHAVGPAFTPIVVRDADVTRRGCGRHVPVQQPAASIVAAGGLLLVAPAECRENARVAAFVDVWSQAAGRYAKWRHSTCARACAMAVVRRACGCGSS